METNETNNVNHELNEKLNMAVMSVGANDFEEFDEFEEETIFPCDEDLEYPQEFLKLESDFLEDKDQEDKLWKARTGLNEDTICGAIETILFMSDKPVAIVKIKNLIDEDMPLRVVHEAIERLQSEYEQKHHGIRLQEVAMGYQFRTKATYSKFVQDLFKVTELVLSPTALEVLAIIAYKQPVSKVEVEKIRGVDSSHIVRGLMDKRLVKVVGRSEEVGKPVLYGTTNEFLEVFNLANVDQLPPEHELEEISKQGVGKISDIKSLINADLQGRFASDEIEELDRLSSSIKSVTSETPFTKSLKVEEKKRSKEGEVTKTAFELLEEFLDKNLVSKANKESKDSEVFTAITAVNVISNLEDGPFNTPEEEEEEFEMIDLDTGEAIIEQDIDDESDDNFEELNLNEVENINVDLDLESIEEQNPETPEEVKEEVVELLGSGDDEAANLAKALDDAFSRLMGGDSLLDEIEDDETTIKDVDSQFDEMVESAKDLDLDLSFMKENNSSTDEDDQSL